MPPRWRRLIAKFRTCEVVDIAANPGDLRGVGEVDAVGVGDPEGAFDDPAVALLDGDVVRVRPAGGLDLVEDGGLQAGLVSLDGQEIVGVAVPGGVNECKP
jgi:hypothetical protein